MTVHVSHDGLETIIIGIKNDLLSSETTASKSIVRLRYLLGVNDDGANATQDSAGRGYITTSQRLSKSFVKSCGTRERALPPKDARRLATDIANRVLKLLRTSSVGGTHGDGEAKQRHPLQTTDGNIGCLSEHEPSKEKLPRTSMSDAPAGDTAKSLGICCHVAFEYLHTSSGEFDPRLCDGLLVLCSRLLCNGQYELFQKDLATVKDMLESSEGGKGQASARHEARDALSTQATGLLLQLKLGADPSCDTLRRSVLFQSLVLKLIASMPLTSPETVLHCLEDQVGGPEAMIMLYLAKSGNNIKVASYLESLYTSVLAIVPITKARPTIVTDDQDRSDAQKSITVFKIQMLGLHYRRQWWRLTGHSDDSAAVPKGFLRTMEACKGLTVRPVHDKRLDIVEKAYKLLELEDLYLTSDPGFRICCFLYELAKDASDTARQIQYLERMGKAVQGLPTNSIQHLLYNIYEFSSPRHISAENTELDRLAEALRSKVIGSALEHATLIGKIEELLLRSSCGSESSDSPAVQRLFVATLQLAQRAWRQSPEHITDPLHRLLRLAFRYSLTRKAVVNHLRKEAVESLIHLGILHLVVEVARSASVKTAWKSSSNAILLNQLIRTLTLRDIRARNQCSGLDSVIQSLPTLEKAMVLECRLQKAMEYGRTGKHNAYLYELTRQVIEELLRLYTPDKHPLRRNILWLHVSLANDMRIVTNEAVEHWSETSSPSIHLSNDTSLHHYRADVHACLDFGQYLQNPASAGHHLQSAMKSMDTILEAHKNGKLEQQMYDPEVSMQLLDCVAAYQKVMNHQVQRVETLVMNARLEMHTLPKTTPYTRLAAILAAVGPFTIGPAVDRLSSLLVEALKTSELKGCTRLSMLVTLAEQHLRNGRISDCRASIFEASAIGPTLLSHASCLAEAVQIMNACATMWQTKSRLSLRTGSVKDALLAGRQATKTANAAWQRVESVHDRPQDAIDAPGDEDEHFVEREQATGVASLRLRLQDSSIQHSEGGALYWETTSASCSALLNLADLYAHLGDFGNADIYSHRALSMSNAISGSGLCLQVNSHRAMLLLRAEKHEEAEALLAGLDCQRLPNCQARIYHVQALAWVDAAQGDFETALQHIRDAEELSSKLRCEVEQCLTPLLSEFTSYVPPVTQLQSRTVGMAHQKHQANMALRQKSVKRTRVPKDAPILQSNYSETEASLAIQKIVIRSRHKGVAEMDAMSIASLKDSIFGSSLRQLAYDISFQDVNDRLRQDLRLIALRDIAIAFPAFSHKRDTNADKTELLGKRQMNRRTAQKVLEAVPNKSYPLSDSVVALTDLISIALGHLPSGNSQESLTSTADVYREKSRYMEAILCGTILRSDDLANIDQGHVLSFQTEYASMLAHGRLRAALTSHPHSEEKGLSWPEEDLASDELLLQDHFQMDYIDMIPKRWTVVSLSLNEQVSKLQMVRYRSGRPPTMISLPFARLDPEMSNDTIFDYTVAKQELTDIIDKSNKSCHVSEGPNHRSKSDWWRERESLDRQLGQLINKLESDWLGGFKGLLSTSHISESDLSMFRRVLEDMMTKNWMSRPASKHKTPMPRPDDFIVELLCHLKGDVGSDSEQALLDFIHFVHDCLRLQAVDLIDDDADFDSMAVELSEALARVPVSIQQEPSPGEHLVLVLDKRLQMFPWESMPCLERVSVSRVGSMNLLREQILAMRRQCQVKHDSLEQPSLDYDSGTAMVNPESDLTQTQAVLQPVLRALQARKPEWDVLTNNMPTEEEFGNALSMSRLFLYFGHGSGAQYIRPQAIRRLQSCSDVVWLMGCSSGTVCEYGEFEPSSIPYSYLLAAQPSTNQDVGEQGPMPRKCLAVLANLWDVTDKDIDRFSISVGAHWGLWPAAAPKNAMKHSRKAHPETEKIPVTPRRPKNVPKTPRKTRCDREQVDASVQDHSPVVDEPVDLGAAVSRSRDACFLRYLNGAAPVIYGVPVSLYTERS